MAVQPNKTFKSFTERQSDTLLDGDYFVGYNADGTQEIRAKVSEKRAREQSYFDGRYPQFDYLPMVNVAKALPSLRWDGTDPNGTNLALVQALINSGKARYYFPRQPGGPLALPGGVLTLPSNVEVYGDLPDFDRVNHVWSGGSVILGSINTGLAAKNVFVHDLGIDNAPGTLTVNGGNGFVCNQKGFWNIRLVRLRTRANDHNILIEQNGTSANGGAAMGGGVLVDDCWGFGGPNGLAIKAYDVLAQNCRMSDTTVQAFVAVSDNINGAAVYSRAEKVRFKDCGGTSNYNMFRVYSRDTRSLNNANGVQVAYFIRWEGGDLGDNGQIGAHVGDFSTQTSGGPVGTQTLLRNRNVRITGAKCNNNGQAGIQVTWVDTMLVDFCDFENNGTVQTPTNQHFQVSTSDTVRNFRIGRNNTFRLAAVGYESGIYTWPAGATSVVGDTGSVLYRTNNTVATTINSVTGVYSIPPATEIKVQIMENFTTLAFAKDVNGATVTKTGKGTIQRALWDSVNSVWVDLG